MRKISIQKFLLFFALMFTLNSVFAHGNQVGYCVLSNGFIRVYIEHWHGDLTVAQLQGNTINVTTTYGTTTINQNVNASGAVNNTSVNNLPGCTSNITVLSGCSGANKYNDWGYFDFAPAACGVPVAITINAGNTQVFDAECTNLYPVTVNATFNDNAPPVITCPVVNVTSCSPLSVNFSATVTDACDPNPTVTYSIAPGSVFNPGTTAVTVTATDNTGKTSTCTFNVNVTPPALNISATSNSPCIGGTLNLNVTTVTGATYLWTGPGGFTSTLPDPSIPNAQLSNSGNYTVKITSGVCVYTASVNATVNPNPTVSAGNDVTFCTGGVQLNAVATDPAPPQSGSKNVCIYDAPGGSGNCNFSANNLCGDGFTFLNGPVTSSPFTIAGATNITSMQVFFYWTCGNGNWTIQLNGVTVGNSGTFNNSVCSCTAPSSTYPASFTITGAQLNANWNFNGNNTITVITNNPGANAVAGYRAIVNYTSGGTYLWTPSAGLSSTSISNPIANPANTTTYTVTYTTAAGCSASDDVIVTKQCCIPPAITCPNNISVTNTAGQCGANVSFAATATGTTPTITYSDASGSFFPVGTTTVNATATNSCGTDACSFTVTVTDNEAPVITCLGNITTSNDAGVCGAKVTYTAPVGTDNCSGSTTTQTAGLPSGSTFPVGTTTNTFVVKDASGNTATCSFTVTVNDTEKPTIVCAPNQTVNSTSLSGAVVTFTAPVGKDNCPGATTTLTAGPASGSTFQIGTTTVTYTVTDASGNTATCSFTVTVKDPFCDRSPNNEKVYVCHNGNTVCVSVNALKAHLDHGDKLGECSWYGTSMPITSAASDNTAEIAINPESIKFGLPAEYKLSNYPNPFVGRSIIKYELPYDSRVSIKVYDVMGRVVSTLVDGEKRAGIYTVEFKSAANNGSLFYRIIAKSKNKLFEQTNKMTQLK